MMAAAQDSAQTKHGKPRPARTLRRLPQRVFLLVLLVALCELVIIGILEVQAGVTAFVRAEGNWSRAQSQAVKSLYLYIDHGDPAELQKVRDAMRVIEGDRQARDALDASPVDLARAREGARMADYAEDVDRLLRTYRLGRALPYFRDAIMQWKTAEPQVLRLGQMADELQQRAQKKLGAADKRRYIDELNRIDTAVQPLEIEFSRQLAEGGDVLRAALLGFATLVFVLLAWYATWTMRRTLRQVRDSEVEFQRAFHQAAVGMLKIDAEGRFTQANEAVARILGLPLHALRHLKLQKVMHADDLDLGADGSLDFAGLAKPGERRLLSRDGGARWVRWTASTVGAPGDGGDQLFVMLEDISDAHELQREIAHQAAHDELTGLINRREIVRRLERVLDGIAASGQAHVLCFLDLDQFKLINDTCGHAAGDRFLCQFGDMIAMRLREGDWVGRLGGDEFAVLLRNTALEEGEQVMGCLHDALGRSVFHWDGRTFPLNCSVGLVQVDAASADVEWVLHAADAACYLAKEEGRNRIRSYRDTDETLARRRSELEWVASAQSAIGENRLLLYAQRIDALGGNGGLRYEVLTRLRDREGEIHTPGKFLAAMERFGQAAVVDRYVFNAVLDELRSDPAHLNRLQLCHINVSAQSIADPAFRAYVAGQLDAAPNVARKLCFEITETAMISNLADARRFIDAIRQRGCKVALDDFGSGLSSFGYLKSLPVDIVKIDSVFVSDLAENESDLVLVRSMSQIARALGKITIAEGIESELVARQLAGIGIDYAQGYGIHRPTPLEEFIERRPPRKKPEAAA